MSGSRNFVFTWNSDITRETADSINYKPFWSFQTALLEHFTLTCCLKKNKKKKKRLIKVYSLCQAEINIVTTHFPVHHRKLFSMRSPMEFKKPQKIRGNSMYICTCRMTGRQLQLSPVTCFKHTRTHKMHFKNSNWNVLQFLYGKTYS